MGAEDVDRGAQPIGSYLPALWLLLSFLRILSNNRRILHTRCGRQKLRHAHKGC